LDISKSALSDPKIPEFDKKIEEIEEKIEHANKNRDYGFAGIAFITYRNKK